tara:strand:+ start:989 stop:1378 length:390 start_codon:yes stop_codon:yes gene_type:complete
MQNEDTISGSISIDTKHEVFELVMSMVDIDKESVQFKLYGRVISDHNLLIWIYDKNDNPHGTMVTDIIEFVVESKHLMAMHYDYDLSEDMLDTFKMFFLDRYCEFIRPNGLQACAETALENMRSMESWD